MKKILLLLLFTAVILLFAVKNTTQILAAADWPSWFITYTGDVHGEEGITSARPALVSGTTCDTTDYPAFFSNVSDYVSSGLITHNGSYDDGCVADNDESKTMDLPLLYGYGGLDIDQSKQRYNYDYFADLISEKIEVGAIPNPLDGFYYINGSISTHDNINVGGNRKAIIFVSGDLTFEEGAKVTVGNKNFLAFIVRGGIKFDPKITDKIKGGVYIAQTIRTGTKNPIDSAGTGLRLSESYNCDDPAFHLNDYRDDTFEAEGIFVAWGDFYLERDREPKCKDPYGNLERQGDRNIREPGEVFYYTPNLLVFAPEEIKLKKLYWEEIAP